MSLSKCMMNKSIKDILYFRRAGKDKLKIDQNIS